MIKTKMLTNDIDYATKMIGYINENFSERALFELERVDLVELSHRAAMCNARLYYDFIDDADIYIVDITLIEFLRDMIPLERTIVMRPASDLTKLEGVQVVQKFVKPAAMVSAVETLYGALEERARVNNEVKRSISTRIKDVICSREEYVSLSNDRLLETIESMVETEIQKLSDEEKEVASLLRQSISSGIYSDIRGLGILDNLLADETVTEIMINAFDTIFVERFGKVERLRDGFASVSQYEDIIQKIVGASGREVNESNPIVDTILADGSRVNVVLSSVALSGSTMTIRKFTKEPMTMERLIELGALTPDVADVLKNMVRARYNIFISGGTSSGKTTFLNALSSYIPRNERIITIEDSAELKLEGVDNLVRMQTKNANATGKGEIKMRSLIKASLRMRPDRIIVGEVRGEEALDMLQAMNTGHDGSLSTGHANSSEDMLLRLETMILQNSDSIPLAALRRQIASSVDIIIHLSRMMDHSRKVLEISEVLGVNRNGEIELNPLYRFEEGELRRTGNELQNTYKLRQVGLTL